MYVVTFYSFKGGVGRSLALANIGLELANSGRQVLLVDFDLEAPGLHTFDLLRPKKAQAGIVEYVNEYMKKGRSPDVKEYIYPVMGVGKKDGRLWIMPSGKGDQEYSRKLERINWTKLYDQNDGYLLFEDLKAQWKLSYEPNYVLIDSRTGHTDTAGICTRQLPNAVVLLFFPNEQNLAGLKTIASNIRQENEINKDKKIKIHYVMSNVPDLDDEQEILAKLQDRFREELRYGKLTAVIYRYESLALLNQTLFVSARPNSRLAKEYRCLMDKITDLNIEDKEGVIRNLRRSSQFYWPEDKDSIEYSEDDITNIQKHHSEDGELTYLLANYLKRQGRRKDAESLLQKAVKMGYRTPKALLEQAELKIQEGDGSEAIKDVFEAFVNEDLDEFLLSKGVEIIRRLQPTKLREAVTKPAFQFLSVTKCITIAQELIWCKDGLEASVKLLEKCYGNPGISVNDKRRIELHLLLSLIGAGYFDKAMRLFGSARPTFADLDVADTFNYGMAEWGKEGKPKKETFKYVVEKDSRYGRRGDPNYHQCIAISIWATGNVENSLQRLEIAENLIKKERTPQFSCWRYMQVTPEDFLEDCDSIRRMINGEKLRPLFLSR
jgi:MinD-like ATPase involved in chromosome partitioning or flagellar assembly